MILGVEICLNCLAAVAEHDAAVQDQTAYVQVDLVVQAEIEQFFQSEIQEQGKMTHNLMVILRKRFFSTLFGQI